MGQPLRTLLATMESPTEVETEEGSSKTSGSISNLIYTKGVTKYKVTPRSNSA